MPRLVFRDTFGGTNGNALRPQWGSKLNFGTVGSSAVAIQGGFGQIISSTKTSTSTGVTLNGIVCPYNADLLVRYASTAALGNIHFRLRATNDLTGNNAGTSGVACIASPGVDSLELGYDDAAGAGFNSLVSVGGTLGGNTTADVWMRLRAIGHRVMVRTWLATAAGEPSVWHLATAGNVFVPAQQSGGRLKVFIENTTAAARTLNLKDVQLWDLDTGPVSPRFGPGLRM